jgi:hypothetical protein
MLLILDEAQTEEEISLGLEMLDTALGQAGPTASS